MNIIPIDAADDPRLELFMNIRDRDLMRSHDSFVCEGAVCLRVLLTAKRFEVRSILMLENKVHNAFEILEQVPAHVPIFSAPQGIIDEIVGFHLHRGILGVGRRGVLSNAHESLTQGDENPSLVVGAVGIANHDNMGGIFRAAAAFGASGVVLDKTCCDPLYRKAIRVSVGAALKVPFAYFDSANDMITQLVANNYDVLALSPSSPRSIHMMKRPKRLALLLGAEGPGLPQEVLQRVDHARISMVDDFDSLNVASAAGIALHHFFNA